MAKNSKGVYSGKNPYESLSRALKNTYGINPEDVSTFVRELKKNNKSPNVIKVLVGGESALTDNYFVVTLDDKSYKINYNMNQKGFENIDGIDYKDVLMPKSKINQVEAQSPIEISSEKLETKESLRFQVSKELEFENLKSKAGDLYFNLIKEDEPENSYFYSTELEKIEALVGGKFVSGDFFDNNKERISSSKYVEKQIEKEVGKTLTKEDYLMFIEKNNNKDDLLLKEDLFELDANVDQSILTAENNAKEAQSNAIEADYASDKSILDYLKDEFSNTFNNFKTFANNFFEVIGLTKPTHEKISKESISDSMSLNKIDNDISKTISVDNNKIEVNGLKENIIKITSEKVMKFFNNEKYLTDKKNLVHSLLDKNNTTMNKDEVIEKVISIITVDKKILDGSLIVNILEFGDSRLNNKLLEINPSKTLLTSLEIKHFGEIRKMISTLKETDSGKELLKNLDPDVFVTAVKLNSLDIASEVVPKTMNVDKISAIVESGNYVGYKLIEKSMEGQSYFKIAINSIDVFKKAVESGSNEIVNDILKSLNVKEGWYLENNIKDKALCLCKSGTSEQLSSFVEYAYKGSDKYTNMTVKSDIGQLSLLEASVWAGNDDVASKLIKDGANTKAKFKDYMTDNSIRKYSIFDIQNRFHSDWGRHLIDGFRTVTNTANHSKKLIHLLADKRMDKSLNTLIEKELSNPNIYEKNKFIKTLNESPVSFNEKLFSKDTKSMLSLSLRSSSGFDIASVLLKYKEVMLPGSKDMIETIFSNRNLIESFMKSDRVPPGNLTNRLEKAILVGCQDSVLVKLVSLGANFTAIPEQIRSRVNQETASKLSLIENKLESVKNSVLQNLNLEHTVENSNNEDASLESDEK